MNLRSSRKFELACRFKYVYMERKNNGEMTSRKPGDPARTVVEGGVIRLRDDRLKDGLL